MVKSKNNTETDITKLKLNSKSIRALSNLLKLFGKSVNLRKLEMLFSKNSLSQLGKEGIEAKKLNQSQSQKNKSQGLKF
ncbi:MAG TPA: hypothetical protein VLL98_01770 [Rickettsiales bacterium]|nr:hypothetical protein [Rickettsiales bacterium]